MKSSTFDTVFLEEARARQVWNQEVGEGSHYSEAHSAGPHVVAAAVVVEYFRGSMLAASLHQCCGNTGPLCSHPTHLRTLERKDPRKVHLRAPKHLPQDVLP